MTESEKIYLATKYFEKGYSYEQLRYDDDLYNYKSDVAKELSDDIWEYHKELKEIGSIAFKEKYKGNVVPKPFTSTFANAVLAVRFY